MDVPAMGVLKVLSVGLHCVLEGGSKKAKITTGFGVHGVPRLIQLAVHASLILDKGPGQPCHQLSAYHLSPSCACTDKAIA